MARRSVLCSGILAHYITGVSVAGKERCIDLCYGELHKRGENIMGNDCVINT